MPKQKKQKLSGETVGKQLLKYVKANDKCFHEADYFENLDLDFWDTLEALSACPHFLRYLRRAQHAIGRRVLAQAMKGKSTALHERYMRFRMVDYNDFVQECARQEWKDRKASEMARADEAIDNLSDFMKTL